MRKFNGYWTKERCKEEALKYKYRSDFFKNQSGAYLKSLHNGWLDEICSHMIEIRKARNYWTKERCKEEALKYKYRSEFQKKSSMDYILCRKNDWLDDFCSHMELLGDLYKRCIYAYEFSDKCVYIGLTFNLKRRDEERKQKENDKVTKHIIETGLQPILIQLTDYIDVKESTIKEGEYVEKYKNDGWNILNVAKTGGVGGGHRKWTKEKCQEEALKYNTKRDFRENSRNAYWSSLDHKWINDICSHMINKKIDENIITKFHTYINESNGKDIILNLEDIKRKYFTNKDFLNQRIRISSSDRDEKLQKITDEIREIYW